MDKYKFNQEMLLLPSPKQCTLLLPSPKLVIPQTPIPVVIPQLSPDVLKEVGEIFQRALAGIKKICDYLTEKVFIPLWRRFEAFFKALGKRRVVKKSRVVHARPLSGKRARIYQRKMQVNYGL